MIVMREPKTEEDALEMREIRNTCSEYMTANNKVISMEDQLEWFRDVVVPGKKESPRRLWTFLVNDKFGTTIGYAIARRKDDGHWWLTAGLKKEFRGAGYGREVFTYLGNLVKYYEKDVWLDVLISNRVAHYLYQKLGYKEVSRTDTVITMRKEL